MPRHARIKQALLYLSLVALTALVLFGRLGGATRFHQAVQNFAHAPVFALVSVILLHLRTHRRPMPSSYLRSYLSIALACVLLGIGIEVVQAFIGGDASIRDVVTDILGSTAALATYASHVEGSDERGFRRRRISLSSLGLSATIIAAAPLAWSAAAYVNRDQHFPTLAQFSSSLDLYFLDAPRPIRDQSLYVHIGPEPWPRISLDEPYPDWSGYRTLVVDLMNPQEASLSLKLRVHDLQHNQELDDRFNLSFETPPFSRKLLRVPLADIETAPRARHMDMTHIAGIVILGTATSAGSNFYLHRIWLE